MVARRRYSRYAAHVQIPWEPLNKAGDGTPIQFAGRPT